MAQRPSISLRTAKPSSIEFSVSVKGTEDEIRVRLGIRASEALYYVIECDPVPNKQDRWVANIPALPKSSEATAEFMIEVIVDGYYFVPIEGDVTFVSKPNVTVEMANPDSITVESSFVVTTHEDGITEDISTSLAGPQQITTLMVSDENQEPRNLHPNQDTEIITDDAFDPKTAAKQIVTKTIGAVKKPTSSGSLFNRKDGKLVIPELDAAEQDRARIARSNKVLDAIRSVK